MSYIRTKDEIRKTEGLTLVDDERFGRRYLNQYNFPYIPIKEADTIAELCDRYIGISNNKPMIIKYEFDEYYDEYGDTYTKEELLIEYDIIYGAIYTDKGLIYVAKMDSEGKLVLI